MSNLIDISAYYARLKRQPAADVAFLPDRVAEHLMQQLQMMTITPERVVSISHPPQTLQAALQQRYSDSEAVHLDAIVQADAALSLAPASADLVLSNLSFDWQQDLQQCFKQLAHRLRPGGLLLFSMYGPDTLQELRYAFSTVSDAQHVHAFFDMHDVGDQLMQAGFTEPVMSRDVITLRYTQLSSLFRDLRQWSVTNVLSNRMKGLMGKRRWQGMLQAYDVFREQGKLPATFEIIYGHAWKPISQQTAADGEVRIPLDTIRRNR